MPGVNDSTPTPFIWIPEAPFCDLGQDRRTPVWQLTQCCGNDAQRSTDGPSSTPALTGETSLSDQTSMAFEATSSPASNTSPHGVAERILSSDATYQPQFAQDVTHEAPARDLQGFSAPAQSSAAQPCADGFGSSNENFMNPCITGQQWITPMPPSADFRYPASPSDSQQYFPGDIGASDAGTMGPCHSLPNRSLGGSGSVKGYWTAPTSHSGDIFGYQTSSGTPLGTHSYLDSGHTYNGRTQTQSYPRSVPYPPSSQAHTCGSPYGQAGASRTIRSSNIMRSAFVSQDPGVGKSFRSSFKENFAIQTSIKVNSYCSSLEDPMSSDNGSIPGDLQDIDLSEAFGSPPLTASWFSESSSNGRTSLPGTAAREEHPSTSPLNAHLGPSSTHPETYHHPVNNQSNGTMVSRLDQNGHYTHTAPCSKHASNSFVAPGTEGASSLAQTAGRTSALMVPLGCHIAGNAHAEGRTTDPTLPQDAYHSLAPNGETRESTSIQNGNHPQPPVFQHPTQQDIRPPLILCIVRQNGLGTENFISPQQVPAPEIPQTTQSVNATLENQVRSIIESALTSQNAAVLPDLDSNAGRTSAVEALRSFLSHGSPLTAPESQTQNINSADAHSTHASGVQKTDLTAREPASPQSHQPGPSQDLDSPQRQARSAGKGPADETPTLVAVLTAPPGEGSQNSSSLNRTHAQGSPSSSVESKPPPVVCQSDSSSNVPQQAERARS